jgi:hypothetical protein
VLSNLDNALVMQVFGNRSDGGHQLPPFFAAHRPGRVAGADRCVGAAIFKERLDR